MQPQQPGMTMQRPMMVQAQPMQPVPMGRPGQPMQARQNMGVGPQGSTPQMSTNAYQNVQNKVGATETGALEKGMHTSKEAASHGAIACKKCGSTNESSTNTVSEQGKRMMVCIVCAPCIFAAMRDKRGYCVQCGFLKWEKAGGQPLRYFSISESKVREKQIQREKARTSYQFSNNKQRRAMRQRGAI